ncbi:hypothetical protein H4C81_07075 [Pseudomonas monteilii]|uniref:hypothetical protein n=1 Tax=Pseudomonas monteilii TaxID=76759 RepID=UPI0015FCA191|nr:hypothetical protein [Pseudomonas monteilii]MBA6088655.1 hypothetical protein [Pseudomonas monteilii]
MPRPSHLIILALAAALYIYALSSDKSLLALPTKPIPGPTLIVWLHSAAPYLIILTYWLGQWAIASSVGHRSIDKVLTHSGARSAGSC